MQAMNLKIIHTFDECLSQTSSTPASSYSYINSVWVEMEG